jgi:hypothetical protein
VTVESTWLLSPSRLSQEAQKGYAHVGTGFHVAKVKQPSTRKIVTAKQGVSHLLIVSGVSGAGKSTFLRQLAKKELPDHIRAQFPPDAEKWVQLDFGIKLWLPIILQLAKKSEISGLVLHYDLTRDQLLTGGYHGDKVLSLLEVARDITVINLQPPFERLALQLWDRAIEKPPEWRNRRPRWLLRDERFGRLLIRAAETISLTPLSLARALPKRLLTEFTVLGILYPVWRGFNHARRWVSANKKQHSFLVLLKRVEKGGRVDEVYERWQEYLLSLPRDGRLIIKQLFVEPDSSTMVGCLYSWRLRLAQETERC